MFYQWQQHDPDKRPRLARTRTGCLTCRRRKVRCNEQRPECGHCSRLHLSCSWPQDGYVPIAKIGKPKTKMDGGHKRLQQKQQRQQQQQQQQQFQTQSQVQSQAQSRSPPHSQQQILPEVEFSEIFNYASFLWDDPSPTFSSEWPTGSSPPLTNGAIVPHDQLQLPFSVMSHEASRRTTTHEEFFDPRELGGTPGSHTSKSAYFTTFNESQLADFFAQSNAPPILAPVETNSRWARMRKMLIYMCGKSTMVKNAVMAFAALQMHSSADQNPTMYTKYYNASREKLVEVLADIRKDQRVMAAELKHILAVVFLLTYIDLLADDVYKAHANLREAYDTLQLVKSGTLGITEKCLLSWLRLLDGRAVSAGGEGLFLNEDDINITEDIETPTEAADDSMENAEAVLEDILTRPAFSFFQKVQSFMGRISRIDPWHRSRGTVEDETEVMIIAQKISKDIKALWQQRPPLMDQAIAQKLAPPLLAPSLANTLTRALMVCYANYHACFVHLHRVAYKNLPRTPDVKNALSAIREVIENIIQLPPDSDPSESVFTFTSGSPLPINMLWPLLMLGVESDDQTQRTWVVASMKSIESIVSNARITADVLEEVIRRQDETGQRVDIRQVMHDTFTRAFAIV
ncbi:hypothetical protein PISL3812_04227 [Talaromyces islandicus]|uniref:Zn(2)-C6 fungal-type domain-containing protein n=1 Tax=Talaromyces islandicus TaxID=28573 RepID=A0A0U1LX88_TALIS|nr:hypothetical protein PISL3812_04227 [Talaromyces islandicus]